MSVLTQRLPTGRSAKHRLVTRALAAGLALATLTPLGPVPAGAHHGWSSFSTRHAYFLSGTVTGVYWGNPHSEVTLRVDATELPADWSSRPLPQGADPSIGEATMASARPYGGEHAHVELVLAGPSWMERWGMDRALTEGETVEVVGFLRSAEDQEFRPVMFWLSNGQGVWQQLTSFPQDPEPAPDNIR